MVNSVLRSRGLTTPDWTSWTSKSVLPNANDAQNDSWSCGYFTCLAAKLLMSGKDLEHATRHGIDAQRAEMIKRILLIP